ncbi:MAG TPA: ABC transporter ATP-binding protein [Pyrinomonadaceae bacterium]|nr:ABC transporter ATP-binding protein [Pyrinomonadaceae bacterium]
MLEAWEIFVKLGDRMVLDDVSFELAEGRILAVVGPNGAGKTTLIKTLNGTIEPIYAGGTFLYSSDLNNRREIVFMSRSEIAREIAVVAQETETRFPVTVLEFVLAGRFVNGGMFGWENDADIDAARLALADCDLAEYGDRLMNELSGGERQRVVLARALATNAQILLLDEPTANLDLAHQAMMFQLVRERCRSCDASAVVITHDLNLAAEFADEVLMLKCGKVAAYGTPDEVLTVENIKNVFGVEVLLDKNPASGNVRVTNVF